MQATERVDGSKPANLAKPIALDEEQFGTPSKIPSEPLSLDLKLLEGSTNQSSLANKLRNQSLYVKFDPLIGASSPGHGLPELDKGGATPPPLPSDVVTATTAAGPSTNPGMSTTTTSAPPSSSTSSEQPDDGERMFTEAEKNEAVQLAVSQAQDEASIVQMEIEELQKKLAIEREQNAQLTAVMEEYSKEISRLMTDSEDKVRIKQLETEKSQVEEDLEKTETAFADLHGKYGKVKEVVENYKRNEKILKDAVVDSQNRHQASEDRYQKLRAHAEAKILEANKEIASVREQYASQITALQMKLKTNEREISSLKRQCQAKDTDNEELTNICDELVKKLDSLGQSA